MNLDDKICYCYDVPLRKLIHFARRTRPSRCSQMTDCLGAGTGCGWCIPFLKRIAVDPERFAVDQMSADEYAEKRRGYIKSDQPKNTF
jgi:NAD(P)H-nitrite reductase large subunit